jgi:hypothetical protein
VVRKSFWKEKLDRVRFLKEKVVVDVDAEPRSAAEQADLERELEELHETLDKLREYVKVEDTFFD